MLVTIVELVGVRAVGRPLGHLDGAWVAIVAATELATYPAYALAYRSVTGLGGVAPVPARTVARIVVAGFGPLTAGGGFAVDRPALAAVGGDEAGARRTVAAMATLEWAVLAPATSATAIALLASRADVAGSLLWPWAIGGPLLVAAMIGLGRPGRGARLARRLPARGAVLSQLLAGVGAVTEMARRPRRHAGAWAGTALYWAAEVAALSAALHAVGLDLGPARTLLVYSTGYLASRRSLPLGGAGLAEALLLYSLAQLHLPLGPATAAVIIYRAFNFVVTIVPALLAYRGLTAA